MKSEEVAAWWPLVERQARKLRFIAKRHTGLDCEDDLVQVGAIKVWRELEEGRKPTVSSVQNAMWDFIRMWSHRGMSNAPAS